MMSKSLWGQESFRNWLSWCMQTHIAIINSQSFLSPWWVKPSIQRFQALPIFLSGCDCREHVQSSSHREDKYEWSGNVSTSIKHQSLKGSPPPFFPLWKCFNLTSVLSVSQHTSEVTRVNQFHSWHRDTSRLFNSQQHIATFCHVVSK